MAQGKNPFGADADDPFAKARGRFGKARTSFEQVIVKENLGKLMLLTPTLFQEKVATRFTKPGDVPPDAVTADVVVWDENNEVSETSGTMIFAKVVVGQLKGRVGTGEAVLGVLSQVPSQKGNDAWLLDSDAVTEEQVDMVLAFLADKEKAQKAAKAEAMKADKAS